MYNCCRSNERVLFELNEIVYVKRAGWMAALVKHKNFRRKDFVDYLRIVTTLCGQLAYLE